MITQRAIKTIRSLITNGNAVLCACILYLPIMTLVIFSFNSSRSTLQWQGFTTEWYFSVWKNQAIVAAVWRSVELASISSFFAVVFGLMISLGLRKIPVRHAERIAAIMVFPLLVPELVIAVGLLLTFSRTYRPVLSHLGLADVPLIPLVCGHLTCALAYVVIIIRARLSHFDENLELAAQNLGANRWQSFTQIILPHIAPAIVCSFLLVFTNSLDDFYVSHFLTLGGSGYTTLPVYLFGLQARSALTPEMNAVASMMMLLSSTLLIITGIIYWRWSYTGGKQFE